MTTHHANAARIWKQGSVPVIYRRTGGLPLMVRLPYREGNGDWLRNDRRRKPTWNKRFKCWEVPKKWFDDLIHRVLRRFHRVYVIQPFRVQEKCAPACWNARGFECECSCMGANHGSNNPAGRWYIISETLAMLWHERELACRLIELPRKT